MAIHVTTRGKRTQRACEPYRHDLAKSYTHLGDLVRNTGSPDRFEEAEVFYRKALDILTVLALERSEITDYQLDLAWGYNRLAGVQYMAGRNDDAKQFLRREIARWEDSASPQRNRAQAILYAQLAKQNSLGKGDAAVTADAGLGPYAAAKAGVVRLVEALARELASSGARG